MRNKGKALLLAATRSGAAEKCVTNSVTIYTASPRKAREIFPDGKLFLSQGSRRSAPARRLTICDGGGGDHVF